MKVLFLQFPLEPAWGGAEEQTLLLAGGLSRAGHQVKLISSNPDLVKAFEDSGIAAQKLWLGWEPTSIKALALLPITCLAVFFILFPILLIGRYPTVICLSFTDKLAAALAAKLFRMRVLWVEHTRLGRWFFKNPLLPAYRGLSKTARIIAPSYFLRNQLIGSGLFIDRTRVVYPGVVLGDPPSQHPAAKPKNVFTIGYLGRLAEEKGVKTLLAALSSLNASYPESAVELLIAGTGPAEAALKKETCGSPLKGRVRFLGRVSDKGRFFDQIDILVVPSILAESFGLAAAEAMAAGVPVIASRTGALPEIVENKRTGLLFEPGNAEELREKIIFYKENREVAQRLAERARATIQSRFSPEQMLLNFTDLLL